MSKKLQRKLKKLVKRAFKNRPFVVAVVATLLLVSFIVYAQYMQNRRMSIDTTSYTPLLRLIGTAESKNNYNAYYANAANTSIVFTEMTIAEVLEWQKNHVQQGSVSSAVGRYQIINTTLDGLVRQLGMSYEQKFDQATQDRLAIALLERRGSIAYINKELSPDRFAANLAQEWASLPKTIGDNPNESYYASDGINHSLVSIPDLLDAIDSIKPQQN